MIITKENITEFNDRKTISTCVCLHCERSKNNLHLNSRYGSFGFGGGYGGGFGGIGYINLDKKFFKLISCHV